jgi:hypothetical protein
LSRQKSIESYDLEVMSPISRRIFERAQATGKSPWRLSLDAGEAGTFLRDFFNGRYAAPSVAKLPRLARALGCSVADLLEPVAPPDDDGPLRSGSAPEEPSPVDQAEENALLAFWRSLTPAGRRRVMLVSIAEARRLIERRRLDQIPQRTP